MELNKKIVGMLMACLLTLVGISGCIQQQGTEGGIIVIPSASASSTDNPKYAMASYYKSEELIINASVSQYQLPLNLNDITNFQNISSRFDINDERKTLLETNGFVVIDHGLEDDIIQPYKTMKLYDIPIFVTSDTLLHLYHIQFDEILKGVEEREFFDKILDISKTSFDKSVEDYETFSDSNLKEATRRNVAYFGVGLSLLQQPTEEYNGSENIREVDFTIPNYAQNEVNEEINLIEAHVGFSESPIFHYNEDYSQYLPRGHYTQSEKLKRYFKAMMWYGRMSFLMKGGEPHCQECDFIISEEDARIATIQSCLIAAFLPTLKSNDNTLENLWNRIYKVTSFFVGIADDLTPYEYLGCIKDVFGLEFNATKLTNDTKLLELKVELVQLRNPEIYGGTGQVIIYKAPGTFTVEDLYEVLNKTKGMRLMGQRFIPDSYMFQQLVFPAVDPYIGTDEPFTWEINPGGDSGRFFPRGLDVMAVLGSERALTILEEEGDTEYIHYYEQLNKLQENFSSLNITEWNRNLYFSWIYTLKSLLKEYNDSYPTFMQTTAWLDKELQTTLASWAELRHDTILYAKQSYTPAPPVSCCCCCPFILANAAIPRPRSPALKSAPAPNRNALNFSRIDFNPSLSDLNRSLVALNPSLSALNRSLVALNPNLPDLNNSLAPFSGLRVAKLKRALPRQTTDLALLNVALILLKTALPRVNNALPLVKTCLALVK
ncbi:Protein of unknown function (DUF3160), partial [Thermoplasmatales archaeon SCGC AB-539-N05]